MAKRKYDGPYRARPVTSDRSGPDEQCTMYCIVHLQSRDPDKYIMLVPYRVYSGKYARESATRAAKNLNIQHQQSVDGFLPFRKKSKTPERQAG